MLRTALQYEEFALDCAAVSQTLSGCFCYATAALSQLGLARHNDSNAVISEMVWSLRPCRWVLSSYPIGRCSAIAACLLQTSKWPQLFELEAEELVPPGNHAQRHCMIWMKSFLVLLLHCKTKGRPLSVTELAGSSCRLLIASDVHSNCSVASL